MASIIPTRKSLPDTVVHPPLTLYRPGTVAIPRGLREEAARISCDDHKFVSKDKYVDLLSIFGRDLVIAGGWCHWHDDSDFAVYTSLLILRNDLESWIETKGREPIRKNPVGTLVRFNASKTHRLNHPRGRWCPIGLWVALAINYQVFPRKAKVIEDMQRMVQIWQ